ncbi:MAG: VCBS repeat-containing protein [Opitutaceae bacterium]|nr:VCBS repeat-containing protein [Opitutaceae bacterium]
MRFQFPCLAALALSCALSLPALVPPEPKLTPLVPAEPVPGAPRLRALDPEQTGVTTPNVFNDPRMWGARFRELTLGAVETGIAIADFNADGRYDLFTVSKNGPCSLYLQVAPWRFEDTAARAGVTGVFEGQLPSNTGVSVVDVNADGLPDIYLCRYDLPNLLWVNNGDGTFREEAAARGLAIKDASVHASWADYDRDGAVDVYLVTNILDFSKSPQGRRDVLLRNAGDGTFKDVTKEAGIWGLTQGHTALWTDLNHDTWPDIYVANDFETPDRLYLNRGNGTFTDVIDERLPHVTYFSMGADSGDINNDGLVDLFITDMRDRTHREYMAGMEEVGRGLWEQERVSKLIPQYMWNALYLNSGGDRFLEAAHLCGMQATGWTWSARLIDLDNDARLDAFVTAGMVRNFIDADVVDRQRVAADLTARALVWKHAPERRETPLVYHNLGGLEFKDVSAEWGMTQPTVAFGCAAADLDGDGDLDLVYANYNAAPTLVQNTGSSGNRVVVALKGGGANPAALGAHVKLVAGGVVQIRQVFTERGIAASEPPEVHFGLGESARIDELTVTWPDGAVSIHRDLPAGHRISLAQPPGPSRPAPAAFHAAPAATALCEEATGTGLDYTHVLRPYDELSRQRLLPRRLHGQSPPLATADVNRDGIDDVFVGGSAGQAGRLFVGRADGTYEVSSSQPWEKTSSATACGATFFDANGDGAPDLHLALGGADLPDGHQYLNDKLYLNDGYGGFREDPDALPGDGAATQAVAIMDFDRDGRLELFVGGRSVAGSYPDSPSSFLFRQEGERWVDITDQIAPGLRTVGMVTAAIWADCDADGTDELILATEWGPIHVFGAEKGRLVEETRARGFAGHKGWWTSLAAGDLNGDGRIDLLAGNVGLNTKYRASAAEPVSLFFGDFDANGRSHLVETQHAEGRLVPVRGRSKLAYAFPWISKKFPTYEAFGRASMEDIFGEKLSRVSSLEVNELRSGVFLQQNDGSFSFQPLPREAQLAPIQAMRLEDLDADGKLDLIAVGNHFFPEPTTGRFDGAQGWILLGDGRGGFKPLWPDRSGFAVPFDSRSVVVLRNPATGKPRIVTSECEHPVRVFDVR